MMINQWVAPRPTSRSPSACSSRWATRSDLDAHRTAGVAGLRPTGEVDVILRPGAIDLGSTTSPCQARDGRGPNGVTGIIGWYVPG
jgi:hypothetical protein